MSQSSPAGGPLAMSSDEPETVPHAVRLLRQGKVVVIPTDTVYGLAAAVDQPTAIQRLYSLKGRPKVKAIPVLVSERSACERIVAQFPDVAISLADAFWPGALTLILPARLDLPRALTSIADDGTITVAVRLPDHELARAIIAGAGGAIGVTSANRSGQPPMLEASTVMRWRIGMPDAVVDGGPMRTSQPSTIVLALNNSIAVVREGAISSRDVCDVVNDGARRLG